MTTFHYLNAEDDMTEVFTYSQCRSFLTVKPKSSGRPRNVVKRFISGFSKTKECPYEPC